MEDRSGCLRREPAERQPGGVLSGRNHSLDGHRTGPLERAGEWEMGGPAETFPSALCMEADQAACVVNRLSASRVAFSPAEIIRSMATGPGR